MGRIVVFDSGFGSLSIIRAIQRHTKSEIIYFADQNNYPYGTKTKQQLEKIITESISNLREMFHPDLIVVGSNTPSLLLEKIFDKDTVMGVYPPLHVAQQTTKTNSIAILVTSSVAKSLDLVQFIDKSITKKIRITIIDASELVDLVESGKFIFQKSFVKKRFLQC